MTGSYSPDARYEFRARDFEYRRAGGESWLAKVYSPEAAGPLPMLLDVHGGVWTLGSRTSNALIDQALAASGVVVVAADFRLAPQHPYPAQVADINYATRWLKAHAAELNGDPRSIGLLGTSSGGHTAMLSAMLPHSPLYCQFSLPEAPAADATVAYVVALWPVLDPYARFLYAQQTGRHDLVTRTTAYFLTHDAMREGNPQLILQRGDPAHLPPALIIQGTADANIPLEIPERFVAAYRRAGGTIELRLFPNMPHGFANRPGPEAECALHMVKSFIAGRLAPLQTALQKPDP